MRVVLPCRPLPERHEVAEVADALTAGTAHLVQLRHQAGARRLAQDRGQLQSLRDGDEGRLLRPLDERHLRPGEELVPPEREVGRQLEGRLAHQDPVDLPGVDDVLDLHEVATPTPFELDVDRDGAAVRDVDEEAKGVPLALDDGRGQRASPRGGADPLERGRRRGVVRDVLAHRLEHRPQRAARDPTVLTAPVPPVGVDPLCGGQLLQQPAGLLRGVRLVAHVASLQQRGHPCPPGRVA